MSKRYKAKRRARYYRMRKANTYQLAQHIVEALIEKSPVLKVVFGSTWRHQLWSLNHLMR